MTPALVRLDHLAAIRVSGADRVALLQGQASNDARKVDASHAQLTSFSNPKGRCYAIAVLAARGDELLLVTERAQAPALAKRLALYVLRSKAKVELAADLAIGGAEGGLAPWGAAAEGERLRIGVPDGRELVVMPSAAAAGLDDGAVAWRRGDVAAGLPTVLPETTEHFVPLWLGLERLGAIDFKKGCYTGQEIVARSHYLGQTKQQLHRARSAVLAAPGTKLYASTDQSIGEVVVAAADGAGCVLLAVAREVPAGATIRFGAVDGAALESLTPVP